MTGSCGVSARSGAGHIREFLQIATEINLRPRTTVFRLDQANDALAAIKNDAIDGAAVIVP